MKLQQAKGLQPGTTVYHKKLRNSNGSPMKAKVLSVKTWKTRPGEVLVSLKHGLYDFAKYNELDIDLITTDETEAACKG